MFAGYRLRGLLGVARCLDESIVRGLNDDEGDVVYVFFFKQKTAYEMRISDWSSDVCSSDLPLYGNDPGSLNSPLSAGPWRRPRCRESKGRLTIPRRCPHNARTMAARIAQISICPVKGLSPQPVPATELSAGQCLPNDRRFAIAHGASHFDTAAPSWHPKRQFLMLMQNEPLAALDTRFDPESGMLTILPDGKIGRPPRRG